MMKTFIEAINEAIHEEMERDENVFVVGEDVGVRGGVFRATQGLIEKYGEDRVIDAPLAESAIAGVGVGAAMYGMRPIAEMQFADFIMPAVNQIVSEAAKIRYRSNNDWTCPMVIRAPFGGGIHGALYHSQSVEAMFSSTPGLKVVIPSDPVDAKGLLKAAIRSNDPVLFFEHKRAYRLLKRNCRRTNTRLKLVRPLSNGKVTISRSSRTVFACIWHKRLRKRSKKKESARTSSIFVPSTRSTKKRSSNRSRRRVKCYS